MKMTVDFPIDVDDIIYCLSSPRYDQGWKWACFPTAVEKIDKKFNGTQKRNVWGIQTTRGTYYLLDSLNKTWFIDEKLAWEKVEKLNKNLNKKK